MISSRRSLLGLLVFAVSLVAHPGYVTGCASELDGPQFGEAEVTCCRTSR